MDGLYRLAEAVRRGTDQVRVRRVIRHFLPESSAGPRLPLVYLDQSVWSSWARGSYPTEPANRLAELAYEGRFLMVVSQWHIVETVKQKGPDLPPDEARRKIEHAEFMRGFPNLIGLRPTHDLLIQEVARAFAAHVEHPLVADPSPYIQVRDLRTAVSHALKNQAGYVPRSFQEARLKPGGRGSMGWWSWMDEQVDVAHQASHRAARKARDRERRPRTWGTELKERLTIKPIVRFFEGIASTLGPRRFAAGLLACRAGTADYLGFEPRTLEFLRWLWALDFHGSAALTYRVAYERLLDPGGERRPDANDGRDTEHGFAAPFVDILVHEGAHYEIARKAGNEAQLPCKVFNGRSKAKPLEKLVDEIVNWR